jgi:hypothetical protein
MIDLKYKRFNARARRERVSDSKAAGRRLPRPAFQNGSAAVQPYRLSCRSCVSRFKIGLVSRQPVLIYGNLCQPIVTIFDPSFFLAGQTVAGDYGLQTAGCGPGNPKPKSTLLHPESTVDLGCETLIWVENDLVQTLLRGCWRSFCPITTGTSRGFDKNQTDTERIIFFRTVDLGCKELSSDTFLPEQVRLSVLTEVGSDDENGTKSCQH